MPLSLDAQFCGRVGAGVLVVAVLRRLLASSELDASNTVPFPVKGTR
jgi:hypothetical protein